MCNAHFERAQIIPKQRANDGFSAKTKVTIEDHIFASKILRKTEPICAEENRDSVVNGLCHADQIVTLEFPDLMLLHVDKYCTFKNATI